MLSPWEESRRRVFFVQLSIEAIHDAVVRQTAITYEQMDRPGNFIYLQTVL